MAMNDLAKVCVHALKIYLCPGASGDTIHMQATVQPISSILSPILVVFDLS
jgi:hypothetical protein